MFKQASKVIHQTVGRVSDEVKEQRMAICQACPFFTSLKRCRKCGCYMPAKTLFVRAKCPIGKW